MNRLEGGVGLSEEFAGRAVPGRDANFRAGLRDVAMRETVKDVDAEQAIKDAALGLIDASTIDHITVTSDDAAFDEPSYFVTIFLRDLHDQPSSARSIEMVGAMRDALFKLGDDRFPHLSFLGPGDEASEDTRPAE